MKRIIIVLLFALMVSFLFAEVRCDSETVTVDTTTYTQKLQIDWQDYPYRAVSMKNLNDSLTVYYQIRNYPYASMKAPTDALDSDKLYYTSLADSLEKTEQLNYESQSGWSRTDIYLSAGTDTLDISVQIEWSAIK